LLFYPNPGSGRFTLFREDAEKSAFLSIRDVWGRVLKTMEMKGQEFEFMIGELPSGMYFLHYQSGSVQSVIRFQKQ
jgi:hypothetical protein